MYALRHFAQITYRKSILCIVIAFLQSPFKKLRVLSQQLECVSRLHKKYNCKLTLAEFAQVWIAHTAS